MPGWRQTLKNMYLNIEDNDILVLPTLFIVV